MAADKPLTAAELREGLDLLAELLERLGTPPTEYGEELLTYAHDLGGIRASVDGLRHPNPLHSRASLKVLRRHLHAEAEQAGR